MGKNPAFFFYPSDWLNDGNLRRCSYDARAVWIDMLCLMWDCKPRGTLSTNGQAWTDQEIADALPGDAMRNLKALSELLTKGVARRQNGSGTVFSKRMMEDETERRQWRQRQQKKRLSVTSRSCHADVTPMSRRSSSSSSSSSQDLMSLEGEEEDAFRVSAAAAFSSLSAEPYGPILFQRAWAHEYAAPAPPCTCGGRHRCAACKTNGFADAMERTIQVCQRNGVAVPGRFYAHKKEIEKSEATALYRKDPQ